jgi:hypothetical protein
LSLFTLLIKKPFLKSNFINLKISKTGIAFTFEVPLNAKGIEKLLLMISYFVHIVVDEICSFEMTSDEKYMAQYVRQEYEGLREKKREVIIN